MTSSGSPPPPPSRIASDTATRVTAATSGRVIPGNVSFAEALAVWRASALDPRVPRFRVIGPLGRGSQGVVVSAEDQDCRRQIAIKTLHRRSRSDEERRRFIHEAQITAQLEHPGIVPVHDIGILPDGAAFYAMKRIDGTTLADILQDEPVHTRTPERQMELLQAFSRVCDTMAFAHSREVIHRDLKPRNIMVGRFGEVLVLDWGLAKVMGDQTSDAHPAHATEANRPVTTESDPNQTGPGCAVGTPSTMSPEQARGQAVSPRSDVYSLGVVLYQILAGCSPYESGDSLNTIEQAARGIWAPLDQRPTGRHLPKRLVAIVHRAMAHKPAERYADAGALAEDLRRYIAGEAVEACRESLVDGLARMCARNRRALGAVGLTLLLSAGIFFAWQVRAVVVEREVRAEMHRKAAQHELSGAVDAARHLYERLVDLDPADRTARGGLTRCQDALRRQAEAENLARRRDEAEAKRRQAEAMAGQTEDPERLAQALKECQGALTLDSANPAIQALYEQITQHLKTLVAQQEQASNRIREEAVRADNAERLAQKAEDAIRAQAYPSARTHLEAAIALRPSPELSTRLSEVLGKLQEQERRQQRLAQLAAADKPLGEVRRYLAAGDGQRAKDALEQVRGIADDHPDLPGLTQQVRAAIDHGLELQARQVLQGALVAIHDAGSQRLLDEAEERCLSLQRQLADQPGDELRRTLAREEAELAGLRSRRAALLATAAASLHQANTIAPWLDEVKQQLALFYAERLREAEQAGDEAGAAACAAQANAYVVGPRSLQLDGLVEILVPADAPAIRLAPLRVGTMRTLVPEASDLSVPAGGRLRVRHGHWLVRGPDGIQTARHFARGEIAEIRLPDIGCQRPDLACIPGGTIYTSHGRAVAYVPTFRLARREVTVGEWLEFLNDPKVLEQYDRALADGHLIYAPRLSYTASQPFWRRQGVLGNGPFLAEREDGAAVNRALPVSGISGDDALAYIAWRSARDRLAWRLPTPAEWTLAVQGGDGRPFPWGWAEDASLAQSAAVAKELLVGGSFPWDRSVQEIEDLAGSVSEFASPDPGSALLPLMGGNRFDRDASRLSAFQRRDMDRRVVHPGAGLRLAADAGP